MIPSGKAHNEMLLAELEDDAGVDTRQRHRREGQDAGLTPRPALPPRHGRAERGRPALRRSSPTATLPARGGWLRVARSDRIASNVHACRTRSRRMRWCARRCAPTPALAWPLLGERLGAEVVVKHENHNPTGAFKVRGGLTYRRRAAPPRARRARRWFRRRAAITARASPSRRGAPGIEPIIYVPHGNSVEKNAAMRALGAELIEYGARLPGGARGGDPRRASRAGSTLVPSFHRDLVLGVATYALELLQRASRSRRALCADRPGLGNLRRIAARDALGLKTEIVGVQAEGAPAYALSFAAGRAVSTNAADTLADGMATRVPDAEALDVIMRGVARIVARQRRRDRRGGARLLDRHAQSRRGRRRGGARRGDAGAARGSAGARSASCSPAATSISTCFNSWIAAAAARDIR